MTGRYALRFGMHGVSDSETELFLSEMTMAEELKTAGYRTNLVGKWHLGMTSWARTPTHRGFDYFYGYLGGYIDYWTKTISGYQDLMENTHLVSDADNGGHPKMIGNTYPYRGSKGSYYRGGDSVPGFIYGPSNLVPKNRVGGTYDGQVHVTDWLPTLMGLATDNAWTGSYIGNEIDGSDRCH
eukprot:gene28547-35426_t